MITLNIINQLIDNNDFNLLKDLIGQEFGLSFETYTKEDLAKKLSTRLQRPDLRSFGKYYDYLISNPSSKAELNDLPAGIMNHVRSHNFLE